MAAWTAFIRPPFGDRLRGQGIVAEQLRPLFAVGCRRTGGVQLDLL